MVMALVFFIGMVLNGLLLFAILKEKSLRKKTIDWAFLYVVSSSFTWGLTGLFFPLWIMFNSEIPDAICTASAVFTNAGAALTIVGHLLVVCERYRSCITERNLTKGEFIAVIIVPLSGVIIPLIGQYFHTGFELDITGVYCTFKYTSTDSLDILFAGIPFIFLCIITNIMGVIYYKIYIKVREVRQEVKNAMNSTNPDLRSDTALNSSKNRNTMNDSFKSGKSRSMDFPVPSQRNVRESIQDNERKVFRRCIILFMAFVISYGGASFIIAYKLISKINPSALFCTLFQASSGLDLWLSPLLLIYLNKQYKEAFQRHVLRKSV
jgi:hypothetical protein